VACLAVLLLAGCGGGGDTPPTGNPPTASTGALTVTIAGLPGSAAPNVTVTGPGGFSRTLSSTTTLTGLTAGEYEVSSPEASAGDDIYAATPSTQRVSVAAGATAALTVSYALVSGSLAIGVSGLPTGATLSLGLRGPNGFSRTIAAAGTVAGLRPGEYTLTAAPSTADGHTYNPSEVSRTLQVSASPTPVAVAVGYTLASGALTGMLTGLPSGANGTIVLLGAGGFRRTLAPGETITNLAPGSYTLTGDPVTVGSDLYNVPTPTNIVVAASTTPVTAMVQYALATGRLTVNVSGLPVGSNASISVQGPAGFSAALTATTTLTGLAPGTYTVSASSVVAGTTTYEPSAASQSVAVAASTAPEAVAVTYAANSGSLQIVMNGLPQSIPGVVTVSGPEGYTANVATTTLLTNLKPGAYSVVAANAPAGLHIYSPTPATQNVTVAAAVTPTVATLTYALNSGMLQVTVNGLPANVPASITVTGPNGFSRQVTATTLLTGLVPGSYTVTGVIVQNGSQFWAPNPATQSVSIPPSIAATQASVNYTTATGALTVTVSGLPVGVSANVVITGPNAYSQGVTATTTLSGLLQGLYTMTASAVTSGANTYTATPATQNVVVGGGATSSLSTTYALSGGPPPPPPGLNLTIDGMHVQQVVQAYAGTVPLIAGRDGLLRVFVKATAANTAAPTVRVRFYTGTTLTNTITITAPSSSVPTTVNEGTLSSSWNYLIPGAAMVTGLKILAEVDPTNTVTETSDADNSFPLSGSAATMDVRTITPFEVRFVPITQSVNSLTGNVNAGNASQFLTFTNQVFPLSSTNSDVRAAYTTAAPVLQADDANGAWSQILSELNALRTADGSTRYYVGVVKTNYSSGIAGLGYVPGRASLSWDFLSSADEVLAHELGHNFGRLHAPCGGAGGPDPSYPYAGGLIGVYGYDIVAGTLKAPTLADLMGYCSTNWISDYTYNAVMTYRQANPLVASSVAAATSRVQRGLLVWGRVHRGQVILEPAFEVNAPAALPGGRGPHRLSALGPQGETLLDLAFDGVHVADVADPTTQHFAFVVPVRAMRGVDPARIRVTALGRTVERFSAATPAVAPTVDRLSGRSVRVRWDATRASAILVRDARTREIVAIARGGESVVDAPSGDVELTVSDGVRSTTRRVRVR
jgi:hypothetical protein